MGLTKVGVKGLDDGTDGQIITYDANGNPVAVGPGTDGQVLTSTGAGSPPAFEDAAGGAALTGSTNNTITTVTGANAIQGEANLTYDGNDITQTIDADSEGVKFNAAGDHKVLITADADRAAADNTICGFRGKWDGTEVGRISFLAGADTTNKDDGHITFNTRPSGSGIAERLRIESGGNALFTTNQVKLYNNVDTSNTYFYAQNTGAGNAGIKMKNTDGEWTIIANDRLRFIDDDAGAERVSILPSGGISFNGDTAAANALDDYEEGDWTPTSSQGGWTFSNNYAKYTKIGRTVYVQCYISISGSGTSSSLIMGGLPFTSTNYAVGSVDFGEGGIKGNYPRAEINNTTIEFFYPSENTSSSRPALPANQIGSSYIILSLEYTAA